MSANLQNPIFIDDAKAREWLEARVWPNGPVCPHCGATADDVTALKGKAHRPGLHQCSQCREQFTVTVKTVFERSKIPLSKWLAALFLLTASKKGVSAHQVHRSLDISYKSAWFMMHRLREALRTGGLLPPMGEGGGPVEADETYLGNLKDGPPVKKKRSGFHKQAVLTLVDRKSGQARSFHIAGSRADDIAPIARQNIAREARLMTDQATWYKKLGAEFASHETVDHGKFEYARGDVTTNTVESYFSVFKRGMKGTYQHCGEKHLHRYLAEFDFRYNTRAGLGVNDYERAELAATGIKGKRLTYRRPDKVAQSSAH
jgi:transposase-like protein